jgi:HlyD family secretion protein
MGVRMSVLDVPVRRSGERARLGVSPGRVAAVLAVFAISFATGYVAYSRYLTQAAPVAPAGQPAQVRRGSVAATVSATGSVVASRQSKLTMQVSGRLKELPVKLGDAVKSGAVLARVDTAPLEIKVEDARNQLQSAKLKLDQLKAGSRPEDIASAEAGVQSAQAKLADVQAGTSAQDIAQAQLSVDSAAASVRSAQSKLDQLKAGPAPADVSAAEQSVVNAKAGLDKAQIALDQLKAGAKPDEIRQQELAIEQAKNSLWSQQLSRDQTCSRTGGACDSARASVAAAESSVTAANEKLKALKQPPSAGDVASRQADIDAARKALEAAQVKLEQTKAGAGPEDLKQAQAALDSARANHQSAIEKVQGLKAGAKPADVEAARSSLIQAQQQLALKKSPSTVMDLQIAEVAVKQAELTIKQAQFDLDSATLTAPYDGIVGAITTNVGEQIGSGTAILTLVDPTLIRTDVSVDESDIAKIAPGMPSQISFDALPDRRFTGKVIGVSPTSTVTQGVATYTVSVSIDSTDGSVPVGLTANVGIVTQQKTDVLLVPNRALRRAGRNQVVDVLTADGKTETRTVTTGLGNDQVTEVVEGVTDGETVLIPSTTTTQPRVGGFGPPGAGAQVIRR